MLYAKYFKLVRLNEKALNLAKTKWFLRATYKLNISFIFRVLVGAPEAQSQYQSSNVRLGGVVYKCRPEGDNSCEEIPFDRDGK